VHTDAFSADDVVLIVDDVLATGGTAAAKAMLVEKMGAKVAGFAFLIELDFLGGRSKLGEPKIISLIHVS
jgi:adenine phosphoribosyltransferase